MDLDDFLKQFEKTDKNNNYRIMSFFSTAMFNICIIPKLFTKEERNNVYTFCKLMFKSIDIPEKEIDKYFDDFEKSCQNSHKLYEDKEK